MAVRSLHGQLVKDKLHLYTEQMVVFTTQRFLLGRNRSE